MEIHVGSKNETKIQSVRDSVILYPKLFPNPNIKGVAVDIEEFGHPKNLDETIQGSIQRAIKAFYNCDYSFGLEGGLMQVPHTRTGFMEVGACAIYDGKRIYIGLSPAFEWPTEVTRLILANEADASLAFKKLGLTEHDKLGAQPGGIVGFLSGGRLNREDYTKHSIIMALIQLEKPELYS